MRLNVRDSIVRRKGRRQPGRHEGVSARAVTTAVVITSSTFMTHPSQEEHSPKGPMFVGGSAESAARFYGSAGGPPEAPPRPPARRASRHTERRSVPATLAESLRIVGVLPSDVPND